MSNLRPIPLLWILLSIANGQNLGPQGVLLPDDAVPPPVDLIQPVPAPEIPIGELPEGPMLPDNLTIDNQGGTIEGNLEDGITLGGPVHVTGDNGLEIFSNRARVDLKAQSVTFGGDVSVYQGNILQRGEKAVYYYEERRLDASGMRITMDPILLEAGKFEGVSDGENTVFIGENAGITTHDVQHPNFWVRAKKTTVYPGDKVTFENLKVYAGDTPIFYLPYLSQPFDASLGYHFLPGGRSNWGPYLLNSYGIMLGGKPNPITGENEDAWLLSQWRFDLRATRGAAIGLDLSDIRAEDSDEITGLSLYYLYDLDPTDSRNGIPRGNVDPNRYQAQLKYRKEFDFEKNADWRFDSNLTLLSDQFYLQDFAPAIYRTNPAPDNTLGIYRNDGDSLLSIFGRFRVNDFYRTDTQSPQIAFDQVRRPIFGSPFLHEGETSYSIRGFQAADITRRNIINPLINLPANDPSIPGLLNQLDRYERRLVNQLRALPPGDPRAPFIRSQLLDGGFHRFHTNHSFSAPITHGDWFTLTPRAGVGYTNYSAIEGPANSDSRFIAHTGIESAVKFSKNYGNYSNYEWGLDGLLHVVQPYVNWSYLSADELERDFPEIDRLTFTTRPRSLDPSRYTAIDEYKAGTSSAWAHATKSLPGAMDNPTTGFISTLTSTDTCRTPSSAASGRTSTTTSLGSRYRGSGRTSRRSFRSSQTAPAFPN